MRPREMHSSSLLLLLVITASLHLTAGMYGFTTKASGTIKEQRQREEQQLIPRIQV